MNLRSNLSNFVPQSLKRQKTYGHRNSKVESHRAVITEANLNYVGSLTLDEDLMDGGQHDRK